MRMTRRTALATAAGVSALSALGLAKAQGNEPIKIGVLIALSGPAACSSMRKYKLLARKAPSFRPTTKLLTVSIAPRVTRSIRVPISPSTRSRTSNVAPATS